MSKDVGSTRTEKLSITIFLEPQARNNNTIFHYILYDCKQNVTKLEDVKIYLHQQRLGSHYMRLIRRFALQLMVTPRKTGKIMREVNLCIEIQKPQEPQHFQHL